MRLLNLHITALKAGFSLLSLALLFSMTVYGQKSKVAAAANAIQGGDLGKAKMLIDEATKNQETVSDAHAWYYKAYIYKELLKKNQPGDQHTVLRAQAIDASKKSLVLDNDTPEAAECRKILQFLNRDLYNEAGNNFNKQNYCLALNEYEAYVDNIKIYNTNDVDTVACHYLGYSAYKCNKLDKATLYLNRSIAINPKDSTMYYMLADVYIKKKSPDEGIATLQKALYIYPENKKFKNELISIFQKYNRWSELDIFLENELKKHPQDIDFLMSYAWFYEQKMEVEPNHRNTYIEKAVEYYSKVLGIEPNHKLANYNTAILLYNEAVRKINNMNYEIGLSELSLTQDESIDIFKRALPFMEKSYSLDPKNKNTVIGLSGIYFSLNDEAKYKQFKSLADAMK